MSGNDNHLRGKDGRTANDAGQGQPRPDEAAAGPPPGIQATHGGRPTGDPLAPEPQSSNVGRDSVPMRDREQTDRSRYTGHGRDTEGAFGEEDVPVDRPQG